MAGLANRRSYTFDAALQLKDAGLVAASAAAQVASSAQVLDVGANPFAGVAVIAASAVEADTGDEEFTIRVEGSNSATFASGIVQLGAIRLGAAAALGANYAAAGVGQYELPFINVQADTVYRYIRAYTKVVGTIATGVNYTAFVGRLPDGF